MYELIQVSDRCYYIQSPAKIGVIKLNDNEVCLIDSGNDKDAGKKVLKVLNAQGWQLKAIYNTHFHADHIGGNKYLQVQTGCKIYAPGIESDFTNHPILEPALLYGGCPPKDLKHKFIMAQESDVLPLMEAVLPEGVEIVQLPGHSFDMVGFKVDDVVFLADCLSSKETIDKYGIGFIYDIQAYMETLEYVKEINVNIFIPSHAAATDNISELVRYNLDKVLEISDYILKICEKPKTFEQILKQLFDVYEMKMTFEQYALVGSTVRSYLTWLKEQDKLAVEFKNNYLYWKTYEG